MPVSTRRRRVVVIAIVGAVIVAAAAVFLVIRSSPLDGGPLRASPEYGYAVPVKVGDRITDAFNPLVLSGRADAVILSVEPVFPRGGLKTLGVLTSDPTREEAVPTEEYATWPPAKAELGHTRQAKGTIMKPSSRTRLPTQLLIGMEVVKPGHLFRSGYWVTYSSDGVTYRRFFRAEITFCTPSAMHGTTCPFLYR